MVALFCTSAAGGADLSVSLFSPTELIELGVGEFALGVGNADFPVNGNVGVSPLNPSPFPELAAEGALLKGFFKRDSGDSLKELVEFVVFNNLLVLFFISSFEVTEYVPSGFAARFHLIFSPFSVTW